MNVMKMKNVDCDDCWESKALFSVSCDECVGWFNSTSSMLFGRWLYNYAWMEFIILIDDIDVIARPKSKKLAACNNVSCMLMVYIPSACLSTAASTDKAKRAQNEKEISITRNCKFDSHIISDCHALVAHTCVHVNKQHEINKLN